MYENVRLKKQMQFLKKHLEKRFLKRMHIMDCDGVGAVFVTMYKIHKVEAIFVLKLDYH